MSIRWNLSNYPRPWGDTKVGYHWSASPRYNGEDNWSFWKDQIQALGIKWVKIVDDLGGQNVTLAKRLVDLGVMPVVRFYLHEGYPQGFHNFELVQKYIEECGVVYFEFGNEPDLALEWENRKRPKNWLEIVVRNFIREAWQVRQLGGWLLFPAFGPGGRGNPFQMIVDNGHSELFNGNMCLALHNYCLGRPLDYPENAVVRYGKPLTPIEWNERGGMWAWEMDYKTVNEHRKRLADPSANILEDSTCFRAYEYFNHLIVEACGHGIPIMMTEGGYNVGQRAGDTGGDDPRFSKPTPYWMSKLQLEMFQAETPDYYFASMPWLIAAGRIGHLAPVWEMQGPLYTHQFDRQFNLQGELPLVGMLKDWTERRVYASGPTPKSWPLYRGPDLTGREFDDNLKFTSPPTLLAPHPNPVWRLQEVRWDKRGSGVAYVRCLRDGKPVGGIGIVSQWEGRTARSFTKADGWGDVPVPDISTQVTLEAEADALIGLRQGTCFLTYVEAKMFNHQAKRQELLSQEFVSSGYGIEAEWKADSRWRLKGVYHLTGAENKDLHNVYIEAVDKAGQRIPVSFAGWTWEGRRPEERADPVRLDKPVGEPAGNIGLHWGQKVEVWIKGYTVTGEDKSDRVFNLHTAHEDEDSGNRRGHHSFYVLFQEVEPGQPPPPVEPPPVNDNAHQAMVQIKVIVDDYFASLL